MAPMHRLAAILRDARKCALLGMRSAAPKKLFEQRRSRHEGIECRPELPAIAILLLEDFVLGAGDDEMRAAAQMIGELLDRGRRDDGVVAGSEHQQRLADLRGIVGSTKTLHRLE